MLVLYCVNMGGEWGKWTDWDNRSATSILLCIVLCVEYNFVIILLSVVERKNESAS